MDNKEISQWIVRRMQDSICNEMLKVSVGLSKEGRDYFARQVDAQRQNVTGADSIEGFQKELIKCYDFFGGMGSLNDVCSDFTIFFDAITRLRNITYKLLGGKIYDYEVFQVITPGTKVKISGEKPFKLDDFGKPEFLLQKDWGKAHTIDCQKGYGIDNMPLYILRGEAEAESHPSMCGAVSTPYWCNIRYNAIEKIRGE